VEIQPPRVITLIKTQFDFIHIKKFNEAVGMHKEGQVCAIVMEEGISHLFLVGASTSKLKGKVEKRISKKKGPFNQHDKQTQKFFEQILQMFILHFKDFIPSLRSIIIGSPGFVKDQFLEYLKKEAGEKQNSVVKNMLPLVILAHTSSGFKHSLHEVLKEKYVQERMKDLSCFQESSYLDKFFEILSTDQNKVCYGPKSVEYAFDS